MKCYIIVPTQPYTGGVILIAADNEKEAEKLIPDYYGEFSEPKEVKELEANVEEPRILFDYTYFE